MKLTNILNTAKKHSREIKRAFAVGVVIAGTIGINYGINSCSKPPKYESACEFYRGYHNIKEENMIIARNYVFDPQRKEDRGKRLAEYVLEGDVSIGDTLPLHKRYCFEFEEPKWPWSQKKLISIRLDSSVIPDNNISEQNK